MKENITTVTINSNDTKTNKETNMHSTIIINSNDMTMNMENNKDTYDDMDTYDMDAEPGMTPYATQERESNSRFQRCTLTKVNGLPYPTIPGTDLMDWIAAETNIVGAIETVYNEVKNMFLPDSEIKVKVCNSILESDEMMETIRQDLLRGVYSPEAIATDMNLKDRIEGLPGVFEATLSQIIQTMVYQIMERANVEMYLHYYPIVSCEGFDFCDVENYFQEAFAKGYKTWISIKLESIYDNIPHDRLMQTLHILFQDDRVVELVRELIIPKVKEEDGQKAGKNIGILNDSLLSILIGSRVYLNELDGAIARINLVSNNMEYAPTYTLRWGDEILVVCISKESAEKKMKEIIDYAENTMKCPVNRELTRIGGEDPSAFGMVMKHGVWTISESLMQDVYSKYLNKLMEYDKTKDVYTLYKACTETSQFAECYKMYFEDDCLELWKKCEEKWKSIVGTDTNAFYRWFPKPLAYEIDFEDLI